MAGQTAVVFRHGEGEKSLVSRDMEVGPASVLQFDVRKLDCISYFCT